MRDAHVVTCFLLRRGADGDRLLLLRRSGRVSTYRGRWAGVSGYLEADPSTESGRARPIDQAHREIEEEVGLSPADVRLLAEGEPLSVADEEIGTRWTVHPFLFDMLRPDAVRLDWEHAESRWVRPADMRALQTVPGLADALARVYPGPAE